MKMRVAFLDLDHTLLVADSNQLWMTYLQSLGMVSSAEFALHEQFMDDYANGVLDFSALQLFRIELDASLELANLNAIRGAFEKDILLPAIAPRAPQLVADLNQRGLITVVVSATRSSLVDPVAQYLGVNHTICSCYGQDKVNQAQSWLKTLGSSLSELDESRFYSDSHNDIPLLESVMNPVAVDPDAELMRISQLKEWKIISLKASNPN